MKIEIACTLASRVRGLLGREDFRDVLMLAPCNDVHTFGMTQPIDIAFVSADGVVLEAHCRVSPRRRLRCKDASATLERFSTEDAWFERGDRIELVGGCNEQASGCEEKEERYEDMSSLQSRRIR